MALDSTASFQAFAVVAVLLNVFMSLSSKKIIRIDGLDLLFFAPWVAGFKFGIYQGLILAGIMLAIHSLMHMRIAKYILLSAPALLLAVLSGHFIGIEGFWITLVGYYFVSTLITAVTGGLGGRYFMFLLVNILTNVGVFFVYQLLF